MEQKGSIGSWTRDQLEDQYLRLYDDYLTLKKHCCKQEERIKKMGTKLLRLASDKKGGGTDAIGREDYEDRITDLERKNNTLTQKPNSARGSNLRTLGGTVKELKTKESAATGALQTVRLQNAALELTIRRLSEQSREQEQLIGRLKEDILIKDANHQKDIQSLVQQMTNKQHDTLKENIDLIRNQRALREKQHQISTLEARVQDAEAGQEATKETNRKLVEEVERLTRELGVLEQKLTTLQLGKNLTSNESLKHLQLQHAFDDLKRENDVLKESNEKLMNKQDTIYTLLLSACRNSAFSGMSEQTWMRQEHALRAQISRLEALLKRQSKVDGTHPESKTEAFVQLQHTAVESAAPGIKAYGQSIVTQKSIEPIAQATGFSSEELEEALMLLRERKSKVIGEDLGLEFMEQVKTTEKGDLAKRLQTSEAAHAETIAELEKTRKLLTVQYRINKDYQAEAKELSERLTQVKSESEQRLTEYAKLLDIRAERVRKLEAQLQDVAYGVKHKGTVQMDLDVCAENRADAVHSAPGARVEAEPGENLVEIHVGQLTLSSTVTEQLVCSKRESPDQQDVLAMQNYLKLFLTWDFYDFETQSTAIVSGSGADFDLTVQYPVKIDDFFLEYLHKGRCVIELHQNLDGRYRTIAAGYLDLSSLLKIPDGDELAIANKASVVRRNGQVDLLGVAGANSLNNQSDLAGLFVGRLDYWLRLSVPMPQAIRLYKERCKSLSLMSSSHKRASSASSKVITQPTSLSTRPVGSDPTENELQIHVIKINNLRSRRPDCLPSPYFVYQFFDQPERDSNVIDATLNATFDDLARFPVRTTQNLDQYLRTQSLKIYVLDNADPEPVASCLGVATIPLLGLATRATGIIEGPFELQSPKLLTTSQPASSHSTGTIHVRLFWKYPYEFGATRPTMSNRLQNVENIAPCNQQEQQSIPPANFESPVEFHLDKKSAESGATTTTKQVVASPQFTRSGQTMEESTDRKRPYVDAESAETFRQLANEDVPLPFQVDENSQSTVPDALGDSVTSVAVKGPKLSGDVGQENVGPVKIIATSKGPRRPMDNESADTFRRLANEDVTLPFMTDDQNIASLEQMEQHAMPAVHSQPPFSGTSYAVSLIHNSIDSGVPKPTPRHRSTKKLSNSHSPSRSQPTHEGDRSDLSHASSVTAEYQSLPSLKRDIEETVNDSPVQIQLHRVEFDKLLEQLNQSAMRRVFVEYQFPGYANPLETASCILQTPSSKNGAKLFAELNYSKTFQIDFVKNYERRQYMASLLLPKDPHQGHIRFTIVAEPLTTTPSAECEEVGIAQVSIRNILTTEKDLERVFVPILPVNAKSVNSTKVDAIGRLCVSMHCLTALQAIRKEMSGTKLAV
ncbi:hypothetical protein P879_04945 [Paragonimus westermani]|uniref:C2 domain-containing protein n=1 Tax=Paragonimus westermani TaxID=34504 RepID=A0A8T0DIV4_9TREM|nr:hypothetical protein P879_04945 [Paragonimus westermani]